MRQSMKWLCGLMVIVAVIYADAAAAESYVPIGSSIVVNLTDEQRQRFLQVNAEAGVDSEGDVSRVESHMPVLRHEIIMMLTGRGWQDAQDVAVREQWRGELLERLRQRMVELTGEPTIDALYFSDLIVQ